MFCESKNLSALVTPREPLARIIYSWSDSFIGWQACEQLILNLSHSGLSLDYNTD